MTTTLLGSCTLTMPMGVERPPFVRVRVTDASGFGIHEGDLRLPDAASGALRGVQLMTGDTPASLSFEVR